VSIGEYVRVIERQGGGGFSSLNCFLIYINRLLVWIMRSLFLCWGAKSHQRWSVVFNRMRVQVKMRVRSLNPVSSNIDRCVFSQAIANTVTAGVNSTISGSQLYHMFWWFTSSDLCLVNRRRIKP